MRCGEQRKAAQPSRSQAERGEEEGQTAARRDAEGGDQVLQGSRPGGQRRAPAAPGNGGKL